MSAGRFGMLRVPMLSVEELESAVADGDTADPVAATAVELAADPYLRDAASYDPSARAAFLRYVSRMGGRATPYGLFAGTAVAALAEERRMELGKREHHAVRVRVDVAALEKAVAEAAEEVSLERWPLRVNPLLRWEGDGVCFPKRGDASADVVRVRSSPVVAEALRICGDREVLGSEVIRALREEMPRFAEHELSSFVGRLVDTGLLERSLGLIEPGVEPAERATALLESMGRADRAAALRTLVDRVGGLRPLDPGIAPDLDAAWEAAADSLPAFTAVERNHRFDLNTELSTEDARVDQAEVRTLRSAMLRVAALQEEAAASQGPGFDFAAFRDAFRERYEGAEVPLLQALDLESGVLRSRQREMSELAGASGVHAEGSSPTPRCPPGLLRIYARWARDGSAVDISDVAPAESCGARAVLAILVGDHPEGLSSVLVGGVGRSPHSLLARFGLNRDEVVRRIQHEDAEPQDGSHQPGAAGSASQPIHAELVYHAGGRIGNVLVRPRILEETVALTGAAGGTLPLHRLTLQLRGDEFVLRDTVSGRPVILELNSAHNLDLFGLDPVYTVLGNLASTGGVGWSWGPLAALPRLPRVTCGSVVVAPERWRLEEADIRAVLESAEPAHRLRDLLEGVGDRRWVGIGEYDHMLPIDLDSSRSVEAAFAGQKRSGHVTVVEMPQMEAPAVHSPHGRHVGELVLPLAPPRRTPSPAVSGALRREGSGDSSAFDLARGRSWVYYKYYCGHASADAVIARVRRLAAELREEGAIAGWFFLRYQDGGYHVRVRMRPAEPEGRPRVVSALDGLGGRLREEGLAARSVLDDYVPEIARYGGAAGLDSAARLFEASSEWTAAFAEAAVPEEQRLYQAVADALLWCSALFDSGDEQLAFLDVCKGGLGVTAEKKGNPLGRFVRTHERALRDHLAEAPADETLRARVAELSSVLSNGSGQPPGDRGAWSVLGSTLHMHCNRMFAFDAVRIEYLVHELAGRTVRRLQAVEGRGV